MLKCQLMSSDSKVFGLFFLSNKALSFWVEGNLKLFERVATQLQLSVTGNIRFL